MKPDWKDAPEWAQYLAMNDNGEWYWHELEPKIVYYIFHSEGKSEQATVFWRESLEKRPS